MHYFEAAEAAAELSAAEHWAMWLTACGTILAAVVPTVLFFVERHERIKLQQKLDDIPRQRAEEEAKRLSLEEQALARRVFPKTGITPLPHTPNSGMLRATFSYAICNRSEGRIWDARIFAKIGDEEHRMLLHVPMLLPYEETTQEDIDFESSRPPHLTKTDVFIEYTNNVGDLWRTYQDGTSELSGRERDRYS